MNEKFKKGQLVKCSLSDTGPSLGLVVQGGNSAAQVIWVEKEMTKKPQWISADYLTVVSK